MNNKWLIVSTFIVISVVMTIFFWRSSNHSLEKLNHGITHLAVVMDGNRRWARKNGFKPWIGHKKGVEPLKAALELCIEQNIPYLSVFAFSLENFKRSTEELSYLFDILAQELATTEFENLVKNNIKVQFIGDRNQFPEQLAATIHNIEQKTAHNTQLTFAIMFCYGGQQEIVAAVQRILHHLKNGDISIESLTPHLFKDFLWTQGIPAPDLIIRTGGQKRLSNFLLYQAAYSELQFLDVYWPEITKKQLHDCLKNFMKTKRNFGA